MIKVRFNKKQRKVIRRIISMQLASLQAILEEDCEEDITMFCIEKGWDKSHFQRLLADRIDDCAHVYEHPSDLLNLPDYELAMIKHILISEIKLPKRMFSLLWRKIMVFEELNFNPN